MKKFYDEAQVREAQNKLSILLPEDDICNGQLFQKFYNTRINQDFTRKDLKRISVVKCQFDNCKFNAVAATGSKFTKVQFDNCDLSGANFQYCYFNNALFINDTIIKGANFSHSIFIDCTFETITTINVASLDMWFGLTFNNPEEVQWLKNIYISVDGVIPTEIEIPYGTTTLKSYLLGNCSNLKTVIIPSTVAAIEDNALCNYTDKMYIYCLRGSVAHDYAVENNIPYKTFDIETKGEAYIDHARKVIYTDSCNLSSIYNVITVTEDKTHFTLGSQYIGGKHIWGTGSTITIYEDEYRTDYTLIINGDINGDSVFDVLDVSYIEKSINNNYELSKNSTIAADVNGDSQITVSDYQKALNTILA